MVQLYRKAFIISNGKVEATLAEFLARPNRPISHVIAEYFQPRLNLACERLLK